MIGSLGHKLVAYLIEKAGGWIARSQDEDFGIDLEAEVCMPEVRGEIIKIQIKGQETTEIKPQGVKAVVDAKYLRLAEVLRVPLIFVVADTTDDRAWYIWLQGWLVDQRRNGRTTQTIGESVTVYIPESDTLAAGLNGPLVEIARWTHENQMVLSIIDTMKTAMSTRNTGALVALADLIGKVDEAYDHFPLEMVIDTVVKMSEQPRASWEMSIYGHFLGLLCRKLGGKITKENLYRMVVPSEGWSRAGLVGLGALYDEHEPHIRAFGLAEMFEKANLPELTYYCRLREKHLGVKAMELALGDYDYTVGNLTVAMEDKGWFQNKWANRGESAYIDYLEEVKPANEPSP
jgi:hypothetical protein